MRSTLLPVHITAGALGIIAGFLALYAVKGAPLHRKSGMVFVYAMITMTMTGGVIAALGNGDGVAIGAVLTAYFVITSLATVRPIDGWSRRLDIGLMVVALAIGVTSLTWGFETVASSSGRREGLPPFPFFMTGIVGLVAAIGDARMIKSGPLRGASRLSRHLWRMCWALWVASGSFFLGQMKVMPKPMRIVPLLAIPAVFPLLMLVYWLWRARGRRTSRGIVGVRVPA
jgi:uncharacterized membrane protein